ncbi:MAG: acylphosphatase [Candidatus Nanohaloarchaeota archaeon QJJ-7]|nr:acylphosphatase [Candidatus Nanohaloarchaeota archaeon QJJ-7]
MRRVHVFVSGKVQGVFFRATTREMARELRVKGWVKNLEDGRVEAVFEGEQEAVEEMVEFCYSGPEAARVEDVKVEEEELEGLEGFEIKQ